jgi:hypothetical protein
MLAALSKESHPMNTDRPALYRAAIRNLATTGVIDPMLMPGMKQVHREMLPGVLKIGRDTLRVVDIADASAAYCAARDESGEGASTFRDGKLTLAGKTYRISYNGKVWADYKRAWKGGDVPAFDPYL